MESNVFNLIDIELAGATERVLAGGRHLFPLLPQAFEGIRRIGVIGWGPQGRAQALNLRDSLAGSAIEVAVGLRAASPSLAEARAEGFSEADGTLGDMFDVIRSSDLVILLIADAALADRHEEIFGAIKPGAIIGLSHGFLLAHLRAQQRDFPPNTSVVAVCPKGMGASVRRLYEQGRDVDGAGINCSIAVHADADGRASDIALGWAVGLGNEIASVRLAAKRLRREPMSTVDGSRMWSIGRQVRQQRDELAVTIDPLTAGIFCGAMMAQVDVFEDADHPWSEIANESIIELVDSLIPYMHARGVAYMIDNCSTTARLGARKWGPRFEAAITQQVSPTLDDIGDRDDALIKQLDEHPIHDVLAAIGRYRPSVNIAVS